MLLSFANTLFLIRYSWNYMIFPIIYQGKFWRFFFFFSKNLIPHWWRHHSWSLVPSNFTRKGVSKFCMLLCCSFLMVWVMSYRIVPVTKLIPNYYSQWRHNDIITSKNMFFFQQKFVETLRKCFVICWYC